MLLLLLLAMLGWILISSWPPSPPSLSPPPPPPPIHNGDLEKGYYTSGKLRSPSGSPCRTSHYLVHSSRALSRFSPVASKCIRQIVCSVNPHFGAHACGVIVVCSNKILISFYRTLVCHKTKDCVKANNFKWQWSCSPLSVRSPSESFDGRMRKILIGKHFG